MNIFNELSKIFASQANVDIEHLINELKHNMPENNGCLKRYLRCQGKCNCNELNQVIKSTESRFLNEDN